MGRRQQKHRQQQETNDEHDEPIALPTEKPIEDDSINASMVNATAPPEDHAESDMPGVSTSTHQETPSSEHAVAAVAAMHSDSDANHTPLLEPQPSMGRDVSQPEVQPSGAERGGGGGGWSTRDVEYHIPSDTDEEDDMDDADAEDALSRFQRNVVAAASTERSPDDQRAQDDACVAVGSLSTSGSLNADTNVPHQPATTFARSTRPSTHQLIEVVKSQALVRQPRYMAALNRDQRSLSSSFHFPSADAENNPSEVALPQRRAFRFPSPSEMELREQAYRTKLVGVETTDRQNIMETFAFRFAEIRISSAKREAYLSSEEYKKYCERGRDRRTRMERLLDAKLDDKDETACTFEPKISRHASLRPRRTRDAFVEANKEWLEAVNKRRRAASAAVLREENVTFAPAISFESKRIVEKLEKDARYNHIVEGWSKRMEEHKLRMRELEAKHAPPFAPQINKHHGDGSSDRPRPTTVSEKTVVSRLYDVAIEHQKAQERKLEAKRKEGKVSPPTVRRSASAIREHLDAMSAIDARVRVKIESKRLSAQRESIERECSPHHPQLSATSAALAELHRQRLIAAHTTTNATVPAASPEARPTETQRNVNHTTPSVFELLYHAQTACMESRQRSTSAERLLQQPLRKSTKGESIKSREIKGSGRKADASAADATAVPARRAAGSREFFLRNEKLIQERSMHVREIQHVLHEREVAECTFAPALSAYSSRLAEGRRSQGRSSRSREHSEPWRHAAQQEWLQDVGVSSGDSRPPLHTTTLRQPGALEASPDPNRDNGYGVYYYRTDNGPRLQPQPSDFQRASLSMASSGSVPQGVDSARSAHGRLDDIEGMMQGWEWLVQQSSNPL